MIRMIAATMVSALCLFTTARAGASVAMHDTILYSFTAAFGSPTSGLISGSAGVFYGAAGSSVYSLSRNAKQQWQVQVIHGFSAGTVITGLIVSGGTIYGIAGNTVFALTPSKTTPAKWTEATIHTFATSGTGPVGPVGMVSPSAGILYLTTRAGGGATACGSDNNVPTGCGTVFTLALSKGKWVGQVVHALAGGSDGALPFAAPSLDRAGNLYFSTYLGGAGGASARGARPAGSGDGCGIATAVVLGLAGSKLGQAVPRAGSGGISYEIAYPCGETSDGAAYPDSVPSLGYLPGAGAKTAANFVIGTGTGGGNVSLCESEGNDGCGTVFRLLPPTKSGARWIYQKLHNFSGSDGLLPYGSLLVDGDLIYGIAYGGDALCDGGCGVIYALKTTGTNIAYLGTAYKFTGSRKDGAGPLDGMVAWNGQILGTTKIGGADNHGVIYALSP